MLSFELWSTMTTHALAVGLADDPGVPVPHADYGIGTINAVPYVVLYPGGRNRLIEQSDDQRDGFTLRSYYWTAVLLLGIKGERSSYELLWRWIDRLDIALEGVADDPENTEGSHPIKTAVSAPFGISYGGPEFLGVTVDIQHSVYTE